MDNIDLALLSDVLTRDEAKVQLAMDRVHEGTGAVMPLAFIFMTSPQKSRAEAIVDYVTLMDSIAAFIGAMRALGEDIAAKPATGANDPIAAIQAHSLDPEKAAAFLTASSAFRCRIKVNDVVKGSGILVSYRLVLTAWHVANREVPWDFADPPKIEILTSDGHTLPARMAKPYSPCHPDEWAGQFPNDNELENFNDYALLRLTQPVGFTLGFAKPTYPPAPWTGSVPCFLVHYPQGTDVGITPGTANFGGAARRYRHNAPSLTGSSGGALFSNACEFLGIHQKAYGDTHRYFVPVRNFANDDTADLVKVVKGDLTPSYLWSIDGSLTNASQLVIGRRVFFDALDHMLDNGGAGSDRLRGIWTRPKRKGDDQSGMSFGYDLLKAFLARRQPDATLTRMALSASATDVFSPLLAAFGLVNEDPLAAAGVREDETTFVAFDADRAKAVVRRIEQSIDGPIWLYIDGPMEELGDIALRQMELLVAQLAQSARIHFVLTRMESHALPLTRFDSLAEIGPLGPPGVVYEYAGDFTLEDVMTTIRAAAHDLALSWDESVIQFLANTAVNGIATSHGLYSASALKTVSDTLLPHLLTRVEAA